MPQPPARQCLADTQVSDAVQICGKSADHVDSANASRRAHHDPVTGARWPSRSDDTDPLADFTRPVERPAIEEN